MVLWTVVLEKTLESSLDCKEIKPVNPKGNQFWIFIGRTDAKAETQILWPLDANNWLIGKYPDAGKELKTGGEGNDKGWDGWMASPTWWTWVWVSLVMDREAWRAAVHEVAKSQSWLNDWIELNGICYLDFVAQNFVKQHFTTTTISLSAP